MLICAAPVEENLEAFMLFLNDSKAGAGPPNALHPFYGA